VGTKQPDQMSTRTITETVLRRSTSRSRTRLPNDPVESSSIAGLRYVRDNVPGIMRRRNGRGFCYENSAGRKIRDTKILERISSLAIPPAWTKVWICPSPDGHLQAVGFDAKGRKQYRYHPRYRRIRNQTKFSRLSDFGQILPVIRYRTKAHLALAGLPKEKVLASVVRLLETTGIRVGNKASATENHTFGLTTLRNNHVKTEGVTLRFRFVGKSGVKQALEVSDPSVARIVRQCHELPGHHLFKYRDESGELHSIDSGNLNAYLNEICGSEVTSKDFRTWVGTVHCAVALQHIGGFRTPAQAKKNVALAIREAAEKLGNRPATCSAYYVHPAVLDAYLDGSLLSLMERARTLPAKAKLFPEEAAVLKIIESHAKTRAALLRTAA